VSYPVLVPNEQGYERARAVGVAEVAVFGAASEAFSRRNINASIDESIERFRRC
jgi:hydroxymethylglutaryl-CoA lyase